MYVASQSTVCEWHQFQGLNEVIYSPYRQNFRACGGLRGNLITPSRTRPRAGVGARLLVPTHCGPHRSERSGTPFRAEPFGTFRGNGKLSRHPPSDPPTHARLSRPRARRAQTTAVHRPRGRAGRAARETLKELKVAHTESCAPSIFTSMPFNLTELLQKARQHSTGLCPTCGRLPSHHSVVNDENCYTHVKMPPAP